MTHQIPVRPDFSQLQNQAKELLRAHKGSDDTCCQTLRLLSELSEASDSQIFGTKIGLRKVQHALALDYGFQSWADLKQHVETTNALDTQLEFLPEIGFNYSDQQRRTEIREAIDIASRFEGKELARIAHQARDQSSAMA